MIDTFIKEIEGRINMLRNDPEIKRKYMIEIRKDEDNFKQNINLLAERSIGRKYTNLFREDKLIHKNTIDKIIPYLMINKNLMITGNIGTGKTMTMLYLYKKLQLLEKRICASFFYFPDLPEKLFNNSEVSIKKYIFLDDIGIEYLSDFNLSKIEIFIEKIYKHDCRMIGTTNISKEEFLTRNNFKRVSDRINQNCIWITLPGDSRRKTGE